MAWTTPKTWSAGETLTAANFNTHIRDNLNAGGPHLVVRKTADESVVSSITPQNDEHLLMAVAANEVWQFEMTLIVTGLFDILGQLTFPSGTLAGVAWGINAGTSSVEAYNLTNTASPSGQFSLRASSATIAQFHQIRGVFANAGTPGNLQLQWAQVSSGGTATIVKTNSTLWAVKLA